MFATITAAQAKWLSLVTLVLSQEMLTAINGDIYKLLAATQDETMNGDERCYYTFELSLTIPPLFYQRYNFTEYFDHRALDMREAINEGYTTHVTLQELNEWQAAYNIHKNIK